MQKLKRRMLPGLSALLLSASLLASPAAGADRSSTEQTLSSRDQELEGEVVLRGQVFSYVVLEVRVQTEDGSPLTGAKVALQEPDNFTRTEETGTAWLLQLIPSRLYKIVVSKSGYVTKEINYTYQKGTVDGLYPKDLLVVKLAAASNSGGGDNSGSGGGGSGGNTGDSGSNGGGSGGNTGDSGSNGGGSGGNTGDSGSNGSGSGGNTGDSGSNGGGSGGSTGDSGSNGGGSGGSTGGNGSNGTGSNAGTGSTGTGSSTGTGTSGSSTGTGSTGTGKNDYISGVATVTPPDGGSDETLPVIEVTFPGDQTEFTLPWDAMSASAQRGEDILLVRPNGSGTATRLQIPAFSDHDLSLVGEDALVVRWTNGGWALVVRVNKEDTERSAAGLCHNLISVALQDDMGLHVIYEDEPERSFYLTAEQVGEMAVNGVDLLFEYDRSRQAAGLAFEVQTAHHGAVDQAVIPAAAFEKAGEMGLELACRIYDPTGSEELWFEWLFAPEDLRGAEGRDVDLYLRATPDSGSALFQLTRGIWSQYIVANQNAALPAKATLRVKNLEDFPVEEAMSLVCVDGRSLELIQDGLSPEGEWYSWETDSCTSCALIEDLDLIEVMGREYSPLRVDKTGDWDHKLIGLLILLPVFLLSLLLLLILLVKKSGDEDELEEDGVAVSE